MTPNPSTFSPRLAKKSALKSAHPCSSTGRPLMTSSLEGQNFMLLILCRRAPKLSEMRQPPRAPPPPDADPAELCERRGAGGDWRRGGRSSVGDRGGSGILPRYPTGSGGSFCRCVISSLALGTFFLPRRWTPKGFKCSRRVTRMSPLASCGMSLSR